MQSKLVKGPRDFVAKKFRNVPEGSGRLRLPIGASVGMIVVFIVIFFVFFWGGGGSGTFIVKLNRGDFVMKALRQ